MICDTYYYCYKRYPLGTREKAVKPGCDWYGCAFTHKAQYKHIAQYTRTDIHKPKVNTKAAFKLINLTQMEVPLCVPRKGATGQILSSIRTVEYHSRSTQHAL